MTFTIVFTAAQAAQKLLRVAYDSLARFTAAQAAQKNLSDANLSGAKFTAAQAAQKIRSPD